MISKKFIDRILKVIIVVIGMSLGYGLLTLFKTFGIISNINLYVYVSAGLISGIIFFIISPKLISMGKKMIEKVEKYLQGVPASDIILGTIGLILGLIIAHLISLPFYKIQIPYLGGIVSVVLYITFGYLGTMVPTKKRDDFSNLFCFFKRSSGKSKNEETVLSNVKPKVLDTSVIIDGRIADICTTGFIEGPLVIPEFVLEELRHIADSSDSLKRNRGRRGLDILNKIQKEIDIEVIIYEKDFEDINEVDSKLLKLGQVLGGKVVTNDFNLNKVAEFHGVDVLNINQLANAVKPVVLPGEEMVVQVIKDGKESGQGVAYLDDGTMIVVDGGRKHIGKTIGVLVTSVLQTDAGRMIFAKPKHMVEKVG